MADMLRIVPGACSTVGHGGAVPLHNPGFVPDEAVARASLPGWWKCGGRRNGPC